MSARSSEQHVERIEIPEPPQGLMGRIAWLGPGFLWMVSAAGSGELLLTPRVADSWATCGDPWGSG